MKAIRVERPGGRETLQLVTLPEPRPERGQLLIAIEFAGVNFIDVYYRQGLYPVASPFTPGTEAAGTVIDVGAGVEDFRVGDRVGYQGVMGAYAERAVVPADRVVRLPDNVSTRNAAALMLQGLTAHYLATSTYPLKSTDTCLVHAAAGGVGQLLCQLAKLRGAQVIGTVSTQQKAEMARTAGADHLIQYTTQDFVAETRRLTVNHGVQVVYDSVGRVTFEHSLACLAPRGLMVLFGQSSGPVPPFQSAVAQSGRLAVPDTTFTRSLCRNSY